ncbi:MAG: KAP family NTPase [Paramuribaculum sp.]|nr:KAP family NTPase [Paramuribaculum sp.]
MATSISDLPYIDEEYDLKTEYYVKGLEAFIRNAQTPMTIALQGEWGSGKTSLMTRLNRVLCHGENSDFIGITINTWEYSMLASPEETVYNILGKLVKDVSKNDSKAKNVFNRFLRGTGRFLYRGGRELLKAVPVAGTTLGFAIEAINVPTENPYITNKEEEASLSEVREALETAVNNRITKEAQKKGIIVFVDDLDRLNPPVAVEILELFKNVFTIENCIFILAIDYEVVVKGLEPKFGKLTNQNEREFRSFFDKIIQVPFSLPVNSYRPISFVVTSLNKIGYIQTKLTDEQQNLFEAVVKASVGNNPRSIKRLINTLSLLDCIAKEQVISNNSAHNYGTDIKLTGDNLILDKLLNFIVVAIQICYSRIYSLLVKKPNFTEWNREFASREGIDAAIDDEDADWKDILEAACTADKYLNLRHLDILKLFSMIIDIVSQSGGNINENINARLKDILDKAAVTGVSANVKVADFDKKAFIQKLYDNVGRRIRQLRPDIEDIKVKNNTGNGGFKFRDENNRGYDIRFIPSYEPDNTVTLTIEMSTKITRSEDMLNKALDDLLENNQLTNALSELDAKISPLLQKLSFFESKHSNDDLWFTSYSEELRYMHEKGFMSGDVTHDAVYRLKLQKASDFEDGRVVDAIADVVIANYDFRKTMSTYR